MVKIRLKRMGSKFRPVYKIVAADARAPRDGKFIEALGHYNPNSKELVLNRELVDKW
ncbi:30S ribosomal protein S16, partial [Mycoplasmopsis edwardii]